MADPKRRADLAAIHCAKRDLGLDDAAYRALLQRVAGVESAAELAPRQRAEVLRELDRLGFRRAPARRAGRARLTGGRQAKKCRAMWIELHKAGVVRDASEAALDRFTKRVAGVDSLAWVDAQEASRVIEALKAMADRHGLLVDGEVIGGR